jgi:replicative DNA helicase
MTNTTPASIEMERALLGCLILAPDNVDEAIEIAPVDAFYRPDHARLASLLVGMKKRAVPIDRVSVGEEVLKAGDDEAFGGYGYVLSLPEHAPARVNWRHYAGEVRDRWLRRKALAGAARLSELAHDLSRPMDDAGALLREVGAQIDTVGDGEDFVLLGDKVNAVLDRAEQASHGKQAHAGPPMHLRSLARIVPSFEPGEVYIIAARPAMGKSALARGFAEQIAMTSDDDGRPSAVAIFSFEMDPEQLAGLSLAAFADVDSRDLRAGRLDQSAWEALTSAGEGMQSLPVYVYDGPTPTVEVLAAKVRSVAARAYKAGHRLRAIVIDYVQLMPSSEGSRGQSTNDRLSHISKSIKILAKDQRVSAIVLSQLSRDVEKRGDKTPTLADLRDSGALEQDAAVIMFPFRPQAYDQEADPGEARIFVRKNRYGECGDAVVRWEGRFTRFVDERTPGTQGFSLGGTL